MEYTKHELFEVYTDKLHLIKWLLRHCDLTKLNLLHKTWSTLLWAWFRLAGTTKFTYSTCCTAQIMQVLDWGETTGKPVCSTTI